MVKTSKLVSKRQKKRKKRRRTIKTITNEFECFDVRPLHCNSCFFLQQKNNKSCTALFLLISYLKYMYNNKFSLALLFWYKFMHRNYCFRRKQHSYAACDAALSKDIKVTYVQLILLSNVKRQ